MGILKNLVNAKVSGNVGSMNFRKRGSQTVVAERSYSNSSKGAGASMLQRAHRSRLANIVNFFRVIQAIEARAWQNKPENNSDFNMFSKYNLAASPIFLTKQEQLARACVIAPYEVSRGSLLALTQSFNEGKFITGVKLEAGFDLSQNTLGALSQMVLANNVDWRNGDKLSIALLLHNIVEVAGIAAPKSAVTYVEITLDVESNESIMSLPNMALAQPTINADGMLCCGYTCNAAFAIHSRKVNGVLETSSQFIVMAAVADALYARYSSKAQQDLAMASYGYQGDVLLTPGSVTEVPAADLKVASITSIKYGDTALVSGSTIQGGSRLVISGTDLTDGNIIVSVAGVKYVPQVATATSREYTISRGGAMTIVVNGATLYTATVEAAPTGVTSFKFDGYTYQTAQSNKSMTAGKVVSIEVNGADLGTLSATGATLSAIGGTATKRTANVTIPAAGQAYTISCGTEVLISGTATASGGGDDHEL